MKENDLTWRPPPKKPTRTHDGKVITTESNVRWSSDTFEIRCWNEEKVRVAFCIDCCDREIISWLAVTGRGISGEMIRDLMTESVEIRFGKEMLPPNLIQFLSDNGSIYRASKTRKFAKALNLTPCTTPSYSPESDGLSESFVKTFKRDYVKVNQIESAEDVLNQLHLWFEDYNNFHPHKGLKMLSPREYRKSMQRT